MLIDYDLITTPLLSCSQLVFGFKYVCNLITHINPTQFIEEFDFIFSWWLLEIASFRATVTFILLFFNLL